MRRARRARRAGVGGVPPPRVPPRQRRARPVRVAVRLDVRRRRHGRRRPPPLSTGRSGRPSLRPGRRLTHRAIHERVPPREGDRNGADHHDEERDRRPDAEHVVPVEVAGLAARARVEDGHGLHLRPRQLARKPQVHAGDDDEEEDDVGPAGDQAGHRPTLAFDRDPAMPRAQLAHDPADGPRSLAKHRAGVRIRIQHALGHGKRDRSVRLGSDRDGGRREVRAIGPQASDERLDRQAFGPRRPAEPIGSESPTTQSAGAHRSGAPR